MKTALSCLAGALYSMAYIAPAPAWLYALIASALVVVIMRCI